MREERSTLLDWTSDEPVDENELTRFAYTTVPLRVTVGTGATLPKVGFTSSESGEYALPEDEAEGMDSVGMAEGVQCR